MCPKQQATPNGGKRETKGNQKARETNGRNTTKQQGKDNIFIFAWTVHCALCCPDCPQFAVHLTIARGTRAGAPTILTMSDDLVNETYAVDNGTAVDNSTITAAEENQEVTSDALAITVTIYGTIMIVGWLYFELFRERHRLAYSTRDRSEETRNRLCEKRYSFLSWIRPVQTLSDDEIVEYCGLDILMFLRFQRVGIKVRISASNHIISCNC